MLLKGDGWRYQAQHLTQTHRAFGLAAVALARQSRAQPSVQRDTSENPPGTIEVEGVTAPDPSVYVHDLEPLDTELGELRRELSRKTAAAHFQNDHIKTLIAQAGEATNRIVELERELDATRERLVHQENENYSLQNSLDLTVSENRRLALDLTDSDIAKKKVRSAFDQCTATLTAVETERAQWVTEAEQSEKLHQAAINELKEKLRAANERATTAETLFALTQRGLFSCCEEIKKAESKLAKVTAARAAADNKLNLLQGQFSELERSHSRLIADSKKLLEKLHGRATALTQVENNIELLAERAATSNAALASRQNAIEELNRQLQGDRKERAAVEAALKKTLAVCAEQQRKLNGRVDVQEKRSKHPEPNSVESMLAETIAF
jgi:chromosome segregation ATPase